MYTVYLSLLNMSYVQRFHLPYLKRIKSENLILNLTFESPLLLQPCATLTLADQRPHFKRTGCKKDQDWMVPLILMLFLPLQGCRTEYRRLCSVLQRRSLHVLFWCLLLMKPSCSNPELLGKQFTIINLLIKWLVRLLGGPVQILVS